MLGARGCYALRCYICTCKRLLFAVFYFREYQSKFCIAAFYICEIIIFVSDCKCKMHITDIFVTFYIRNTIFLANIAKKQFAVFENMFHYDRNTSIRISMRPDVWKE